MTRKHTLSRWLSNYKATNFKAYLDSHNKIDFVIYNVKKMYPLKWGKNFKTVNGEMAQPEIRK